MSTQLQLTPAEERLAAQLPDGALLEALRSRGLPNRRVEEWKWSDLRAALKEARQPSAAYDYTAADDEPLLAALGGYEIVIANGAVRGPAGLPVSIRVQMKDAAPRLIPDAPLASLATSARTLDIGIEESLEAPLFIRHLSQGQGAHADRVKIHVAPGVKVTLIETHRLTGAPFANSLTDLVIGKGASVTRVILQPAADVAVSVETSMISIGEDAEFHQLTQAGGAAFSRHETHVDYAGTGKVRLDGLYRLNGTRHNDLTSHVTHGVPGAVTRQLVKGITDDRARGVFQGKFLVERDGQQTDAQMAHHALVLSGASTVYAKPELEIYADDVECAHGNTVGALDAEALFYLRQRGLDETAAQRLLIDAFSAEVLEEIENDKLRDALTGFFGEGGMS
ncbi:Fe-S cluster assembly protein SufD [Parvularcula marina]|uniref:Fe-S cluster assembly protein SufD n=1 Tax=Parvularcula marina TaxID=2292771 RepID=A0A371RFH2_9PROT|nr:Fe-S cluster assembly protein SufD [Parvularcula marina]RFB04208.1 Fe-S cluster assembly protein SufD [Parvularcula marina]